MIWETVSAAHTPFFALAPMIDVTDQVFRQIVARCAPPDVFFTEFVSVDSLASPGREKMYQKLAFGETDQPLVVQVWGLKPENYEAQCKELSGAGYAGIDINMGCPVAKVIQKGACSALMNNRVLAKEIIDAAKRGAESEVMPVSVKTRIGFHEIDLSWIEFLLLQDLPALTVHLRTVEELSKVPSHFEVLSDIVEMRNTIAPHTKIIANGDILTRAQGEQVADQYGVDGIMIGRGIFHDPYVFSRNSTWNSMSRQERLNLFADHVDLFDETWKGIKNPDTLKRFAKTYIVGFPGAPQMRDEMMSQRDIDGVRGYIKQLIDS